MLSRLPDKLARIRRALHYKLGTEAALYDGKRPGDLILMFHNVLPVARPDINPRNIGVHDFRKILQYLKKKFALVPVDEIFESKSSVKRIAITFDDGLYNNLKYASPVLQELEIPAAIFITTSWIHGSNILWPDELSLLLHHHRDELSFENRLFRREARNQFRDVTNGEKIETFLVRSSQQIVEAFITSLKKATHYEPSQDFENEEVWRVMKGEEIKILAESPLITIGSHCSTHRNLTLLDPEEVLNEFVESKNYLQQVTGKVVSSMAFPFGHYSPEIVELASVAGYQHLLAVDLLAAPDTMDNRLRKRLGIYNDRGVTEQLHLINKSFS